MRVEGMDLDGNPQSADIALRPVNGCGCCIPNHKPFKSIHRVVISKPGTGWVKLVEHNYQTGTSGATLGYWEPDETEPLRRVMRITGLDCSKTHSVRLFYRRKFAGVRSIYDNIPMTSPLSIAHMIRAQKLGLDQQKADQAEYHEGKAVQILQEELFQSRPVTRTVMQATAPFFQIRSIR